MFERGRLRFWLFGTLVFVALWGCKSTTQPSDSQVTSIHDGQYYLGLQKSTEQTHHYFMDLRGQLNKSYGYYYVFVVCLIQNRSFTNPSHGSIPRYVRNSGVRRMSYEVDSSSCIPAFMGKNGLVFKMVPSQVRPDQVQRQNHYLQGESTRQSLENGMIEVAAMGTGASFAGFSPSFRRSVMALLPQSLPRHGLIATIVQLINVSLPHQNTSTDHFMSLIMDQQTVMSLHPVVEKTPQTNRYLSGSQALVGGAAGGFVLTSAGVYVGGAWGGIVGQQIIPFLSAFLLQTEENPAQDILDNFQSLYTVRKNDRDVGQKVSRVLDAQIVLGKSLVIAGWASENQLFEVCYPQVKNSSDETSKDPTCSKLFD